MSLNFHFHYLNKVANSFAFIKAHTKQLPVYWKTRELTPALHEAITRAQNELNKGKPFTDASQVPEDLQPYLDGEFETFDTIVGRTRNRLIVRNIRSTTEGMPIRYRDGRNVDHGLSGQVKFHGKNISGFTLGTGYSEPVPFEINGTPLEVNGKPILTYKNGTVNRGIDVNIVKPHTDITQRTAGNRLVRNLEVTRNSHHGKPFAQFEGNRNVNFIDFVDGADGTATFSVIDPNRFLNHDGLPPEELRVSYPANKTLELDIEADLNDGRQGHFMIEPVIPKVTTGTVAVRDPQGVISYLPIDEHGDTILYVKPIAPTLTLAKPSVSSFSQEPPRRFRAQSVATQTSANPLKKAPALPPLLSQITLSKSALSSVSSISPSATTLSTEEAPLSVKEVASTWEKRSKYAVPVFPQRWESEPFVKNKVLARLPQGL